MCSFHISALRPLISREPKRWAGVLYINTETWMTDISECRASLPFSATNNKLRGILFLFLFFSITTSRSYISPKKNLTIFDTSLIIFLHWRFFHMDNGAA